MSDQSGNVIFYLLALILPASALLARGLPIGQMLRMALAWVAIFAAGLLLVTLWTRNRATIDDLLVSAGLKQQLISGGTITLARNADGHFYADVAINGRQTRLLIDSGATETAISADLARNADVAIDEGVADNVQAIVETANGTITVQTGTIRRLRLGTITTRDLPVLIAPSFGDGVLGMNFLNRLASWRVEGDRMILVGRTDASGSTEI